MRHDCRRVGERIEYVPVSELACGEFSLLRAGGRTARKRSHRTLRGERRGEDRAAYRPRDEEIASTPQSPKSSSSTRCGILGKRPWATAGSTSRQARAQSRGERPWAWSGRSTGELRSTRRHPVEGPIGPATSSTPLKRSAQIADHAGPCSPGTEPTGCGTADAEESRLARLRTDGTGTGHRSTPRSLIPRCSIG